MRIIEGDCVEKMRELDEASVDAVVTDPPYGLGFMGREWDDLPPGDEFASEALRVLKPGGHLLAFGGTRTYHRLACAVEDAGFEIRDSLIWAYGSGFPKSLNLNGDHEGWGTALKPSHEPIVLARKPLTGTVAANVEQFGTGALNVDGCRIGSSGGMTRHTASDGEHRDRWDGNTATGEVTEHGGRWPPNLTLTHPPDCSDECVAGCPVAEMDRQSGTSTSAGGQASLGAFRNGEIYGAGRDEREARDPGFGDTGGASRFFPRFRYEAKASRAERNAGLEGFEERGAANPYAAGDGMAGRSLVDGEWVNTDSPRKARANHHPTVKPIALMRWLCRLVTPPGGLVLDPFLGSGTTGCAAALEDFDFIGIEREPEYIKIAEARIEYWRSQPVALSLFG